MHLQKAQIVKQLLYRIENVIDKPDAGIWEFRGFQQHHCYTYLCHWVGSRAALKIALAINDTPLAIKAQQLIDISSSMIEKCYNSELHAYTQAIGVSNLDASTLQLILLQYINPRSEKAQLHLKALEQVLGFENGLFHRYIHQDDFGVPHTTFLACAFWYTEALACVGRVDDAIRVFDNLLSYSNHVGLFSEHVGLDGSQWGNFPQTYSHVGLMNAAYQIARSLNLPPYL
jgi:glucoamylase